MPLLWYGYRRATEVLCISEYTEQQIVEAIGIDNTAVVPLGTDLEQYGCDNPTEDGFILSVGAIKPRKGQHMLLEAFDKISKEFPDIDIIFAGPVHNTEYQRKLESFAEECKLDDRVQFLGKVEEGKLDRLYCDCTLFALTPQIVDDNFEGFGLVYLEAAAYNKPSVGTVSGGVASAVVNGETGSLAPEGDVEGVAEALRELLADSDRRHKYGENARERVEGLTWDRYASELLTRFESAIQLH